MKTIWLSQVAHSVTCGHHSSTCQHSAHVCQESRDLGHVCQDQFETGNRLCLTRNMKNSSKRFFPHLEQIPEESRNNTFKSQPREASDTSSDGSVSTQDIEYKEEINYNPGTALSQESSTNKSNPRSMDSGIATR